LIQHDRPQKDHRLFKILNEALSGKKKKAGNDFEMGEMGTDDEEDYILMCYIKNSRSFGVRSLAAHIYYA